MATWVYADWTKLNDVDFHVTCEQLGEAIRLPLKIGFRTRLRSKTMEAQAGLPSAQSLSPSSGNAQPAPPSTSTEVTVHPASAGAAAKQPRLPSPVNTVSSTAALEGSTGETLRQQLRRELSGTSVCGG